MLVPLIAPGHAFGQAKTVELSPLLAKSSLLGAVDQNQQISIVLTLPLSNPQGAAEFVQHVSKPGDPLFHQYLTPQEFAARYGANAADYAALKQWAANNGLAIVHESLARTSLTVRGSTAQLQTLFKTELNRYRSPDGKQFYSAAIRPTVPDEISSRVSCVIGLTNSAHYASLAKPYKVLGEDAAVPAASPDIGGTGPGGSYSASDLRTCYQIPNFGNLVPETVAVFEQGGFYQSDVDKYLKAMKLTHPPVTFVSVDGYNGAVDNNDVELEAVLDIDMIIGINPKVQEVLVYEDGNDPFGVAIIDALDQVATDNKAQTLSISYGIDEVQQGDAQIAAEGQALTQLQTEGITVLVSAGDNGAYGRTGGFSNPAQLNAPDPGSQPLVTCVGGTTLTTGPGEVYNGEEVWNRLALGFGATGGGVSSYWPIPSWQLPSYVTGNGGSSTYRSVPDVGAVGDPLTGVGIYSSPNGGWVQIGGTSVSAPIWGGYISVLNAGMQYLLGQKIGFFNPTLYSIGFNDPANYLFPVPDGSNGNAALYGGTPGYNAGFGYTNCTGSGTIFGGGFTTQVILASTTGGKAPSGFVFFPLKVTKTSVELHWTESDLATGYIIELITPTSPFNTSAAYVTKKTRLTITGLTPGTPHYLYAYAVNAGGHTEEFTDFVTK
ncbi:MAG: S8 family serine peptidase [Verrucomicrobia bacterium]|nr:S8 family serine peptidase [Verrucomicrobiota bacterium]